MTVICGRLSISVLLGNRMTNAGRFRDAKSPGASDQTRLGTSKCGLEPFALFSYVP